MKTPPASENADGVFHAFTSCEVAALERKTWFRWFGSGNGCFFSTALCRINGPPFKQSEAFRGVARIVERSGKKFLALACEFFLRCPEVCNPCCDFLPLPGGPLLLFGHNSPCLSRVSRALVAAIGARIGARALRDCGCQPRSRIAGAFRAAVL